MSISNSIYHFVNTALNEGKIEALDKIYVTNRLLALLNQQDYQPDVESSAPTNLLEIMDTMVEFARDNDLIEDSLNEKEQFEAAIMDLITPKPAQLNQVFWEKYENNPVDATNYFYDLSQANDYIKTRNIARNIAFESESKYGPLEITINLSKPEKDPKEIAKAKTAVSSAYPKCALCMENEGYQGHLNHAARQNHRIIRFNLGEEVYGLQYSPYVYYNEHSIFLNESHKPMKIDLKCFQNLLEIVTIFPHYFSGSNADLPIVGGSILSHDHYQGGHYSFPMEKATAYASSSLKAFPDLTVEFIHWPLTVIRLRGENKESLANASDLILSQWRGYSDPSLDILAETNGTPHNTITPIARRKDNLYELDLVLRNNRTTDEFPDGIFHPHQDVQHIKKENIGLIEVMGLAILPARLVQELKAVSAFITDELSIDEVADLHQEWAKELKADWNTSDKNIEDYVNAGVGQKFERVLEDAGVFKLDEAGKIGLQKFVYHVNQTSN